MYDADDTMAEALKRPWENDINPGDSFDLHFPPNKVLVTSKSPADSYRFAPLDGMLGVEEGGNV